MTDPRWPTAPTSSPSRPRSSSRSSPSKPDAVLPTLGGQTGLDIGLALMSGALGRLAGASSSAPAGGHPQGRGPRTLQAVRGEIGLESAQRTRPRSTRPACARRSASYVIRPSFTLGGSGGGIAYNREEFDKMVAYGLELSPVHSILVEESVIGWKKSEMEVMRDCADNAVIVCSIENFDPMGVHTGDSVTVAPARASPTRNTSGCATPRSPSSARSASRPAARTCSSPSTRRPGG
ncbi:MAG: hypothetical protein U0835_23735 [Isosphaeraceae bacterium]